MKSFRRLVRHSILSLLISLVLVSSLFVYWGIESLLRQYVDSRLLAFAITLGQILEKRPDVIPRFDNDILASTEGLSEGRQPELTEAAHSVHLLAPDGRVLWQAAGAARRPELTSAALERVRNGETVYDTVYSGSGTWARRVSIPVPRHGDVRSILQTEVSFLFYEKTLSQIGLLLLIVASGTILMAWVTSGWLADKLLTPINALSATAETISDPKHAGRFGLDSPYEEFQQLSSSFNAMLIRLQKSGESQRRFVDYAAHEMQTPLTVLQANLEVTLHKARTIEEYREALLSNLEQVERLVTLARELLALSRLSGDRSPVRLTSLDLEPLLKDLIGELTVVAEDRQIRLALRAQPVPPVLGDSQWLKQLFINFLDNALRYTEEGGAVTVSLRQDGKDVAIAVEDTGLGIGPEHLPHLFERFYRTEAARSRNSGGTGLGLPIVMEIAQAHRGTVTVESEVGKGSIFTFKLPSGEI
jgi:signal transduction histidine kinase